MFSERIEKLELSARGLVAGLGDTSDAVCAFLYGLEVGQAQFDIDGLGVSAGVCIPVDVDDILIIETSNDVNDRVGFADIAEELISQPFTLRGTFYEPRNIDELDRRGHDRLGMDEILELFEANVGDGDDPGVGLDRTEWIVLGLDSSRSECVENGALPDVREADDAASQCHGRRMFPNS